MSSGRRAVCLAIVFIVVGLCICLGYTYLTASRYESSFDLGADVTLTIICKPSYEVSHEFVYSVASQNDVFVPETHFMSLHATEERPSFQVMWSEDRRTVGVVDNRHPRTILLIYDTETHDSWPYRGDHQGASDHRDKGMRLLELLEVGNDGQKGLKLAS
jgi:hypothetical protein